MPKQLCLVYYKSAYSNCSRYTYYSRINIIMPHQNMVTVGQHWRQGCDFHLISDPSRWAGLKIIRHRRLRKHCNMLVKSFRSHMVGIILNGMYQIYCCELQYVNTSPVLSKDASKLNFEFSDDGFNEYDFVINSPVCAFGPGHGRKVKWSKLYLN